MPMRLFALLLLLATAHGVRAIDLVLPTENTAIFRGGGPAYYQYVERNFQGVQSSPWQGGQYGFVRDPIETSAGVVFRKFHEGIDIKPMRRDASGMPLDDVRAVAEGSVVHASDVAGASNYGRYVVIRHLWDGCAYYTLYAHLNRVLVQAGQRVDKGQRIGILGFTGAGINLVRAHLHFEINLLLSNDFEMWHLRNFAGEPNKHGLYNGMNLVGLDAAAFLLKNRANPALTIPEFLAEAEVFYKVRVPAPGPVGLARRYPWMAPGYRGGAAEISLTRSGLPVRIAAASGFAGEKPEVCWVRSTRIPLGYVTKRFVSGTPASPVLGVEGLRYASLLCGN